MKYIKVTNTNKLAIVDDKNYARCTFTCKWHLSSYDKNNVGKVIITHIGEYQVPLSNYVMGDINCEFMFDHADRDIYNNLESNLRVCTHQQNQFNKDKQKGSYTSKYKGVSWFRRDQCWRAYIVINNKQKHLGYFSDEIQAARAYNAAAIKYFGEFAKLNEFPVVAIA